jgi:hypothetical protein
VVLSKRFDSTLDVSTQRRFLFGIFRYGIRFRFTIMIESRSAHFAVNRGPIHTGENEDVTFNGALQFVATLSAHSGLGSESLSNAGNPWFSRQTIL